MHVHFAELAAPLRVGGLEKACRELEQTLTSAGHKVTVSENALPEERPDVVHFHGLWSPAHARLARQARKLGIPYLTSPHGMLEPWAMGAKRLKKLVYFQLIERAKIAAGGALLATAEQEADRLRARFPKTRIEVRALGSFFSQKPAYADARTALEWAPEEKVLVYLSRVHPKKGLLELLQALNGVLPQGADPSAPWRLVVIGEGDQAYVDRCHEAARPLEGRLRLDWLGPIWGDEKWRYLQGADLMCLPTYSENFGLIVLESLEVGTPVLTTVETPWKPVATAGHGWVTTPEVTAYEEALHEFAAKPRPTPEAREATASWARAHYAWANLAPTYLELYESLCSGE